MRLLRMALLVVLVSAGLLVTGGAPTFACSCALQPWSGHVAGADEIFAGTLVSITDPPHKDVITSSDPITYTVDVDAVYRGAVGATAEFRSAMSGASCGLEGMVVGRRYLVFASTDGASRTAGLCGGTTSATQASVKAVERLTGAPTPPEVDGKAHQASEVVASAAGDSDRPPVAVPAWVIATGVIGAAALLGPRLRRRAAQH